MIINIDNYIKYWAKLINEDNNLYDGMYTENEENDNSQKVPVISSHDEFLNICKKRNVEVERKSVAKQGKVVNGRIADKEENVKSREGMEQVRPGDLVIDDGDNTFYVVAKENIKNFYDVDDDGNSAVDKNNKKWRKIAQTLYYYITPFDVDVKVDWQKDPLHAKQGYALVSNEKQKDYKKGADLSPVAPEKFQDKTLWRIVNEGFSNSGLMGEGIKDFFGKLFNTKAYQKEQEELKKKDEELRKIQAEKDEERRQKEYEDFLENMKNSSPLAKVVQNYGQDEIELKVEKREIEFHDRPYTIRTVIGIFKNEPDKDKLEKAFSNTNATLIYQEQFDEWKKNNEHKEAKTYMLTKNKKNMWILLDAWYIGGNSKDIRSDFL